MNLHEYQAKGLFKQFGLSVPLGFIVSNVEEALHAADQLNKSEGWVVKAQVHAGGRGKAGGVQLVKTKAELGTVARQLLHHRLVTYQTSSDGQMVNQLLIEETCAIEKEFYLGALIDRTLQRIVILASQEGGMDIEKVASEHPEKIIKLIIDPLLGVMPYQCRELGMQLGLSGGVLKQLIQIVTQMGRLFKELDVSLLEINPLVLNKNNQLIRLDGKINLDDNALYRQNSLRSLYDPTQEDSRELRAKEWDLSYIALEGNIACLVNGAGLAMATMDLIKLQGGNPANFLDVGGSATAERVTEAFKIILSDPQVKAILVNIFGGIVRCDLIAEGIIEAVRLTKSTVPVVVRLQGNQAKQAELLQASGLNIIAEPDLARAAEQAVQVSKKSK